MNFIRTLTYTYHINQLSKFYVHNYDMMQDVHKDVWKYTNAKLNQFSMSVCEFAKAKNHIEWTLFNCHTKNVKENNDRHWIENSYNLIYKVCLNMSKPRFIIKCSNFIHSLMGYILLIRKIYVRALYTYLNFVFLQI